MSIPPVPASCRVDQTVQDALHALTKAMSELALLRAELPEDDKSLALNELGTLALLTHHRGRHYMLDLSDEGDPRDRDGADHVLTALVEAHERLIEQTSASSSFRWLQFVNDVGAVCRGLKNHVKRD